MKLLVARIAAALALSVAPFAALAQENVLNLYSARHYQTDEALYSDFTKATGIRINRIEASDDQLLERLKSEGANSPADVLLIVDAARVAKAEEMGLLQPVKSKVLEERIPAQFRDPEGEWFAFSTRARIIVYNKAMVNAADVASYASRAAPKFKGKVCTRSGSHPYNLSLVAATIAHEGEPKAEAWAKGVVDNLARKPQGGDTDQIKAVAAGECAVAISNSYYYARLMRSQKPDEREMVAKTGVTWPSLAGQGTHVNVSAGAVLKNAPHRANAIKFLEYLASDSAQRYFADGNNEWPVVKSVKVSNPALDQLGTFKADPLPIAALGKNSAAAQKLVDRAGWR
ncbi:MAG TPA: Fe(3+) ABC transporter substrate-binding protein [Casimicrobiaceae bacterium]|nr:Fe(3+) ABC transporter substrate-binding protein [Casimicrobiaceae bacterium]